jgi:hypothetical protein
MRVFLLIILMAVLPGLSGGAGAHHILGRPAYNLNEDSNTPPAMQAEVMLGEYQLNYMIYPAFPRPGDGARVSLYIIGADDAVPFDGKVTFTIRELPWWSWFGDGGHEDRLGRQSPDDKVYRQGFIVPDEGNYLISAHFTGDDEPYTASFPLRVGAPPLVGPFALAVGGLLAVLILIAVVRRRKSITAKIRAARSAGR